MVNPAPEGRSPLAVAGLQFVHRAEAGMAVPVSISPSWPGSRVVDDPVEVDHVLGDTTATGLRLIASAPLPTGDFFLDSANQLAVRVPGHAPGGLHPQLLRTVARGRSYRIAYHGLEDPLRLPQAWHRTITMVTLPQRRRGVLAHAAAFVLGEDSGVLCPGVSGTGKSTLAATVASGGSEETFGLSDDRVAVTVGGDRLRLWGTPWSSAAGIASPGEACLRALVFVERGPGARLRPLSQSRALRILLRTVAIPVWDEPATAFVLEMIDRMVSEVPIFEFAYTPSPSAAATLIKELRSTMDTRSES